jgi:hypothetical protein
MPVEITCLEGGYLVCTGNMCKPARFAFDQLDDAMRFVAQQMLRDRAKQTDLDARSTAAGGNIGEPV